MESYIVFGCVHEMSFEIKKKKLLINPNTMVFILWFGTTWGLSYQ